MLYAHIAQLGHLACQTIPEAPVITIPPKTETDPEQRAKPKEHVSPKRRTQSDSVQLIPVSSPSLEYDDDSFDLYPEVEGRRRNQAIMLDDILFKIKLLKR